MVFCVSFLVKYFDFFFVYYSVRDYISCNVELILLMSVIWLGCYVYLK